MGAVAVSWPNLPPHIAARLGRIQMDDDCRQTVAMAEAAGERVMVKRLQLGDWRAPGFGEWRVVYQTPERHVTK